METRRLITRLFCIAVLLLATVMSGLLTAQPVAAKPPVLLTTPPANLSAGATVPLTGMPDLDPTSGRFLNVVRGTASLGDVGGTNNVLSVSLAVPASLTAFKLQIFDGSLSGKWDFGNTAAWPTSNTGDQVIFNLYRDPLLKLNSNAADRLYQWNGGTMPDDAWCVLSPSNFSSCDTSGLALIPQDPGAYNAEDNVYYYNLALDWVQPLTLVNEQNGLKVALQGSAFIMEGSSIGFVAYGPNDPRPQFFPPTTYDGTFEWTVRLMEPSVRLTFWDGDLDRADDTNDPNSPPQPPFPTSPQTLNQGVNPGDPLDDSPYWQFVIPPPIKYTIIAPGDLWTAINDNPSGNQEWEVFKVGLDDGSTPDADVVVSGIPAGEYTWRIEGADGRNTLFFHPEHKATMGDSGCRMKLDKTCATMAEGPAPFVCSDAKPIDSLSMIWQPGDGTRVHIKAWKGAINSTLLADVDNIKPGDQVIVTGYAGSGNDVIWQVFYAGTETPYGTGKSTFHLSCSDVDMNGPEDCGKIAGDGKALTGYVNKWVFDGMAGANDQVLKCTPDDPSLNHTCVAELGPRPNCQTVGKPTSLTFRYTGGGCAASSNTQALGKAICTPSNPPLDPLLPVTVTTTNTGYTITPAVVSPGGEFTVSASTFNTDSYFTLTNPGGASENNKIHTSCSQPLQAGDVYGSLTLEEFNGKREGAEVEFQYILTNNGNGGH